MTTRETKLNEAYEVATEMLDCLGIEYGNVTELVINTRFKRKWGQCSYNRITGEFKISISYKLFGDDAPDMGLLQTIVHELLHTCDGCLNHGEKWKKYANMVNTEFNLGVKRCNSAEEKGLAEDENMGYHPQAVKYQLRCPNCGHIYERKRMCYPVQHPEKCGCPRCNHWGLELI